MATIIVNNPNSTPVNGETNLQQAIVEANSGDTIEIATTAAGESAPVEISKNLTFVGVLGDGSANSNGYPIVDFNSFNSQNSQFQLYGLQIDPGVSVTFQNLYIGTYNQQPDAADGIGGTDGADGEDGDGPGAAGGDGETGQDSQTGGSSALTASGIDNKGTLTLVNSWVVGIGGIQGGIGGDGGDGGEGGAGGSGGNGDPAGDGGDGGNGGNGGSAITLLNEGTLNLKDSGVEGNIATAGDGGAGGGGGAGGDAGAPGDDSYGNPSDATYGDPGNGGNGGNGGDGGTGVGGIENQGTINVSGGGIVVDNTGTGGSAGDAGDGGTGGLIGTGEDGNPGTSGTSGEWFNNLFNQGGTISGNLLTSGHFYNFDSVNVPQSNVVTNGSAVRLTYQVDEFGDTSAAGSVQWAVVVSGSNGPTAADFGSATLPHGTLTFSAGNSGAIEETTSVSLTLTDSAPNQQFSIVLSNPASGDALGTMSSMTQDINASPLFVSNALQEPAAGNELGIGKAARITLDMSEQRLTVSGKPQLTLNDGGVAAYAPALSDLASGTLVFTYTVASGQHTDDLQVTGVVNGGVVTDAGHNHADFSSYLTSSAADLDVIVDGLRPMVSAITATPTSGGTAGLDTTVAIDLDFSDAPLVVSGTPVLKLSDGGTAYYTSGGSSNPTNGILEFDYTVASGQSSKDLEIVGIDLPNGASITDLAGNAANLTMSASEKNLHLAVDSIPPKVVAATAIASPLGTEVSSGGSIAITLKLSEAVTVSGAGPVLDLNDGATAAYVGQTNTSTLVFTYSVGSETTADLKITGIESGGTVTDSAGNSLPSALAANLKVAVNTDSWKAAKSGDFDVGSDWTLGSAPAPSQEASIGIAGGYTVSSTADETVAALAIGDKAATLLIGSGTTFSVSSGTGPDAILGTIKLQNAATLDLGGTVVNSGTLFASGSGSTIDIAGVVNGGVAEIGNGIVDIEGASGENVSFAAGGSGGLQLDDAVGGAYSGKVSGFGKDSSQYIDLTQIDSAGAVLSYAPANKANTSGTLTVTSDTTSASIELIGKYTFANFTLGSDGSGHVLITDPSLALQNNRVALLANYMAASFVQAAGYQGEPTLQESTPGQHQPLLAQPRG